MRMPLKLASKLRAEKDKKIAFRRVAKHKADPKSHSTIHHEPKAEPEQVQNHVCQHVKKGSGNGDGAQLTPLEDEQNRRRSAAPKKMWSRLEAECKEDHTKLLSTKDDQA